MKRGFLTAKAGRPDVYRAANDILSHAVDGRIVLALRPPGYEESQEEANHDGEEQSHDDETISDEGESEEEDEEQWGEYGEEEEERKKVEEVAGEEEEERQGQGQRKVKDDDDEDGEEVREGDKKEEEEEEAEVTKKELGKGVMDAEGLETKDSLGPTTRRERIVRNPFSLLDSD